MNFLPLEIVDQISSLLTRNDLKNTLLLSNAFRFSAEKYSGAYNTFLLRKENKEQFLHTFSSHRFAYLRVVEFPIQLPRIEFIYASRDSVDELSANDKCFTEQIRFLFATLKLIEDRASMAHGPGKIQIALGRPFREISQQYEPTAFRCNCSWRVHLLQPEILPSLKSIRSLKVTNSWLGTSWRYENDYKWADIKMDYRVMVDLAVKLPNLEYWCCRLGGDEWSRKWESEGANYLFQDWAGPRRDTRHDFALALQSAQLPSTLRHVSLDFVHDLQFASGFDHLTAQPDLVHPALLDPFSTSLHQLSGSLRRVHLRGVIGDSLFWPNDGSVTSWPNLETLYVMFHMVTPSGRWYFKGPSDEGLNTPAFKVTGSSYPPLETTEYDREMIDDIYEGGYAEDESADKQLRIVPNDVEMRPFLAAFAKAAAKMKKLREATLWCPLAWCPNQDYDDIDYSDRAEAEWLPETTGNDWSLAWGIEYLAPGERDWTQSSGPRFEVAQLWWKVSQWRPDPELHDIFRRLGGSPNILEHWTDNIHGEFLVSLHRFNYLTVKS